ncbi:MAG: 30S ribosomal protein S20 [Thermoleophilia bacterium]
MANIKQQRKRVKIAARQRLENLKYKSRIKTMFKSLTVTAQEDKERAAQMGLELISLIDKAASRGVLHANAASHKKSRVTSIIELAEGTGKTKGPATREGKDGKSKKDLRAERHDAKDKRAAAVKDKKKLQAEAAAKAEKTAKARAKKEEAAAAKAAPAEEALAETAATEETPAEAAVAEPAADEKAPAEESPAKTDEPAEKAEAEAE